MKISSICPTLRIFFEWRNINVFFSATMRWILTFIHRGIGKWQENFVGGRKKYIFPLYICFQRMDWGHLPLRDISDTLFSPSKFYAFLYFVFLFSRWNTICDFEIRTHLKNICLSIKCCRTWLLYLFLDIQKRVMIKQLLLHDIFKFNQIIFLLRLRKKIYIVKLIENKEIVWKRELTIFRQTDAQFPKQSANNSQSRQLILCIFSPEISDFSYYIYSSEINLK